MNGYHLPDIDIRGKRWPASVRSVGFHDFSHIVLGFRNTGDYPVWGYSAGPGIVCG